jgi:endonuclease/exonuclease/phosphatase family metal-dependent hydrolase
MRIMTCNIRTSLASDHDNNWGHRRDICVEVMLSRSPDIICCQEVQFCQFEYLLAHLPGYAWFGTGDTPGPVMPTNAMFYRTERFTMLSGGAYWLSETPHVCGSSSWDSKCVRLANWMRLADRETQSEFRVVNTHLDHMSAPARAGQAGVICEDTAAYADEYPQLLTGDMNADAAAPAIATFRSAGWRDTWEEAQGTEDPGPTFHNFLKPGSKQPRIDWIFARGAVDCQDAEVIRDLPDGRCPSDHYFLSADVQIERNET